MFEFIGGFGPFIVLFLRIIIPFTIFKWNLWGILASLIIDAIDVVLIDLFGGAAFSIDYHRLDKILDMYYLSIALFVSLKWTVLAKYTSLALFVYRMIGIVLFEITGARIYLFIFQNLFENFFIFEAVRQKFFSSWELTPKRLVWALVLLEIPKMLQEYILHFKELKPWTWMKQELFSSFFK